MHAFRRIGPLRAYGAAVTLAREKGGTRSVLQRHKEKKNVIENSVVQLHK
jgi:hypothetical protein